MEVTELEVYSAASNYAVIRPPGRKFPGAVVQGDSLFILFSLARSLRDRSASLGDEDLTGDADELVELLGSRLRQYESVLDQHGIELPYARESWEDA